MTVPNILTIFRFFLVPIFIKVFFSLGAFWGVNHFWAFAIFVLAWITDVLDGKIARSNNGKYETQFGRWADPLADKLMALAALGCLASAKHLPWIFFYIFLINTSLLVAGTAVMYFKKKDKEVRQADYLGKSAMGATLIGLASAFFNNRVEPWVTVTIAIMCLAVVMNGISFFHYYRKHYRRSGK